MSTYRSKSDLSLARGRSKVVYLSLIYLGLINSSNCASVRTSPSIPPVPSSVCLADVAAPNAARSGSFRLSHGVDRARIDESELSTDGAEDSKHESASLVMMSKELHTGYCSDKLIERP